MLQAIDEANGALMEQLQGQQQLAAYRAGFVAAIQAVATAFDVYLEPRTPVVIQVERPLLESRRSR